ncbi:hypothetical protein QUF70_07845 [Desulfobacterales bacterium HSG17]|nr:hypothetical protein [Desulfobacterales bacterium HSG17]
MHALRIKKQIDSEILYLPEFKNMIGKNVEIIILEESEKERSDADFFMPSTDSEEKKDKLSLPSLAEFRSSLSIKGKPMSQTLADLRDEERY